ncbi:MAG: hypothetical protein WC536_01125 [Patescibacteria group bacterium]
MKEAIDGEIIKKENEKWARFLYKVYKRKRDKQNKTHNQHNDGIYES